MAMLHVAKSQGGGPAGLRVLHRGYGFFVSTVGRCVTFGLFWFGSILFKRSASIVVVVVRRLKWELWVFGALSCSEMTDSGFALNAAAALAAPFPGLAAALLPCYCPVPARPVAFKNRGSFCWSDLIQGM